MLTRWLYIPPLIIAGYFLYLTYQTGANYLMFILPAVIFIAIVYIMSPQINFWWSNKRTPRIEKKALQLLEQHHRFYQKLPPQLQEKFRKRVVLIRMAKDFKSQAIDDLPEELKIIFTANLAHLTFGLKKFLLRQYEKVVFYPSAFPSPTYPDTFHASETNHEDGVFLFSAQHLLSGFTEPDRFYNVALHELAVGYMTANPGLPWPDIDASAWTELGRIKGFTKEHIEKLIGRPDLEILAVMVVHWLEYPTELLAVFPSECKHLQQCFSQVQNDNL